MNNLKKLSFCFLSNVAIGLAYYFFLIKYSEIDGIIIAISSILFLITSTLFGVLFSALLLNILFDKLKIKLNKLSLWLLSVFSVLLPSVKIVFILLGAEGNLTCKDLFKLKHLMEFCNWEINFWPNILLNLFFVCVFIGLFNFIRIKMSKRDF